MPHPWRPWKNLLTKFHDDQTIKVASRVLTRKNVLPSGGHVLQKKNAPPLGRHVFQTLRTILEILQEDWTINVVSRVKNDLPLGCHVFQPTGIILEIVQDMFKSSDQA
ncbi:hypothetical protein DPMN_015648 [Dreissena polymorpha]|uniref:Uncharacterized protein n=1 Tax=Dreissena polymorpha TaxID=45954 RepID=A0A9D4ND77_DREPO|nr:hypothetical protein DPMN_015648 [Dreissena polymorpha]